jgi:nucleoid-associated protein YgaU
MRISRTGWALTVSSAVVVALLAPDCGALAADLSGPSFPDAALAAASLALLGIASWSLLTVAAVTAGVSSRLVTAATPAALRTALLVGAAGALSIAPAHAEQRGAPPSAPHSVSGLALPDRPEAESVQRSSAPSPGAADPPAETVRVRPGDTLWAIARRSLPAGASVAAVADAATAWHRANRGVIGDDPDLIVPGQLLEPPHRKDRA